MTLITSAIWEATSRLHLPIKEVEVGSDASDEDEDDKCAPRVSSFKRNGYKRNINVDA